jgi:ribonuclease P protein component
MQPPINRYTLPKAYMLAGKKQFETLFQSGEAFFVYPYRIIYQIEKSSTKPNFEIGISVPKRKFKLAVDRNRLKRLTKEAFRLQQAPLHEYLKMGDIVIKILFIYTHTAKLDFETVQKSMVKTIKQFETIIAKHYATRQ